MTRPNLPLDLREYTHDGPGFPTRDLQARHSAAIEPAVREGRLVVRIDGALEELETLTAVPPGDGPFPLALISHGIRIDAARGTLRNYLPLAESFARRGYHAVAFARRGTFLRDIGAPGWQLDPASATVAKPAPPAGLGAANEAAWYGHLGRAGHKAFAVGSNGGYGHANARRSQQEAEEVALAYCEEFTTNCRIVGTGSGSD